MNFRGLIWKRVWKIIFLVWYRVRIGRTARNTPRRIPRRNPSSPTTWHVILRGETTWNTRYWDFCDQLSGSLRGVLFNRIRPKYALKWRYSRSNGETVSYISLAANYISYIHSWHCYLHFKIIICSLRIFDRFFVLMCHPGQLLKVGKRVVKCGLIVNSVNYSLWTLDLKLLENFQKPLNPTLSQFSDQGFCNTWLVTKMKFNLSAKSKARHCLIIVYFCWAKILHNSISC